MPSQKQEFAFPETTEQLLLIAYGTFLELEWTLKYAGPNAIIGYTPRRWNKYDDEILVEAVDGTLTVTSGLVHNESFDMLGKNKKHINDFMAAFEKVKREGIKEEWTAAIEELRRQTKEKAAEETMQTEEVDKVMNFSSSNLYATYTIIAINVIVFILMAINGAGIFESNSLVHIKWGSNFTPLTLSGDWWRLITCMFIHFGVIHILMNSYALYMAGVYLEPMLDKTKYILAYLCTGVFASLASLWWHKEGVNSAGASGAIFGLYGVFLALLFTNLIPKQIRTALLSSIGVFVVYNLIYGVKSGVDNAAHIGGLLSGIVVGFIYYPFLKTRDNKNKTNIVLASIVAATALVAWLYLSSPGNKVDAQTRKAALNELKETVYPDSEKFYDRYNEFVEADRRIVNMFNDGSASYSEWLSKNESNMSKELDQATNIINSMKSYDVSETAKAKLDLLEQLLDSRKEGASIIKKLSMEDNAANKLRQAEIRNKQEEILAELKKLNQ